MDNPMLHNLFLYGGRGNRNPNASFQDQQGHGGFLSGGLLQSYFQQQQQQQQNAAAQAAAAMADRHFGGLGNSAPIDGELRSGLLLEGSKGFTSQGLANQLASATTDHRNKCDPNQFLRQEIQDLPQQKHTNDWIGSMSGEGDPFAENAILGPWSATSAALLGNMAVTNQEQQGKKIRKKPKDKPKRPLSAYNIFFKEERHRILEEIPESDTNKTDEKGGGRIRKKRPHGKIGFESLAKAIGQRWQDLGPEQVKYYKGKAQEDMQRYKKEMEKYLANEKRKDQPQGSGGDQDRRSVEAKSTGDDLVFEQVAKRAKTEVDSGATF
jgi:hypothetical protein